MCCSLNIIEKKIFKLQQNLLSHLYNSTDITNIIKILDHNEILKMLFLDPYQSNLLNNSKIIFDKNYQHFKQEFLQNCEDVENFYLYNTNDELKLRKTVDHFKRNFGSRI